MKKLDILKKIRDQYIAQGISTKDIDSVIDELKVNEDTSATGGVSVGSTVSALGIANVGASTAGMGPIVSSNPSSNPGSTIGTDFTSGGGTIGSGDIGVPLGGRNYNIGMNHGASTGKKSRIPMSVKKAVSKMKFDKPKKSGKIMKFDDFKKDDINKVKKINDFKTK